MSVQASFGVLALAAKILITRASVDPRPGAERTVSAISPLAILMWQGQSARRPVLPPSEHYRVLSEGLEGLAAGNRANLRKGHPCPFMSMFFSRGRMRAPSRSKN